MHVSSSAYALRGQFTPKWNIYEASWHLTLFVLWKQISGGFYGEYWLKLRKSTIKSFKSGPREAQCYVNEKRFKELNLFIESHHRTCLDDSFMNQTEIVFSVSTVLFKSPLVLTKSPFIWFKNTVKYTMLQKIYISNKCCSLNFLFIKKSWKNVSGLPQIY